MKAQLSQSLIDEFNLVEIDDPEKDNYRPEYKFIDFVPDSGHLLWFYADGSIGMAKQVYMNNDDTHFWWGYAGAINFHTDNEVRNQLHHLRASIKKRIKEGKERVARRKIIKMQKDFV